MAATGRNPGGHAPLGNHRDRAVGVVGAAVDAVPGVARDLGDGRVQRRDRAQHRVRQVGALRTGTEQAADQGQREQRLVRAGDANRDGLGLVLDGIDGPGQLVDAGGEGGGQLVQQGGRGVVDLCQATVPGGPRAGERHRLQGHHDAAGRRRLQRAVVVALAEPLGEVGDDGLQLGTERGEELVVAGRGDVVVQGRPSPAQREGVTVDGQGGVVPEEVAGHGGEDEGEGRVSRRHGHDVGCGAEAALPLGGDDDGGTLVGAEDGDLLANVGGGGPREPGGADQRQGLGGEVDVLLVLGGVAGDRLVAELGQLDADLVGGDQVPPVPDDRPGPSPGGVPGGQLGDVGLLAEDLLHSIGEGDQAGEQLVGPVGIAAPGSIRQGQAQQLPGGDLGVERLGRGHAHLDVATVGGVEDAVGLVAELAAAPVDDGDDRGPAGSDQVDGAVGVGRGPRLADGDRQDVGHVR